MPELVRSIEREAYALSTDYKKRASTSKPDAGRYMLKSSDLLYHAGSRRCIKNVDYCAQPKQEPWRRSDDLNYLCR